MRTWQRDARPGPSLSVFHEQRRFLGFGAILVQSSSREGAGVRLAQLLPCSRPGNGRYLGQGSTASPPAPKTPFPAPQTPSAGAGSPRLAPCHPPAPTGLPPPNSDCQNRTPTTSTPPRGACGLTHPPSSCVMGHPCTFGRWSSLTHESHLFGLGRVAACPWDEHAPCGGRLGTRMCSATCCHRSGKRPTSRPSSEHPLGWRVH